MKREELKALGLTDEQVDAVMAENGKDIQREKSKLDAEKEISKAQKAQLDEVSTKLKDFESMDIESIKKSADEWKAKYEEDTKALKEANEKQAYTHAVDEYFNGIEFANKRIKESVKNEFIGKGFKLDDGKFLGGNDWIADLQKNEPDIFKTKENATENNQSRRSFSTSTQLNSSSNTNNSGRVSLRDGIASAMSRK